VKRNILLKCIRKSQRKRGHEESEQEEETKVPKRTARRKLFTLNEVLNAIVCAICGERVEHDNELSFDDCKMCMLTKAYQDITRIIFQIPKKTLFSVIRATMKTLQTTA
jgi:hypothetical protein